MTMRVGEFVRQVVTLAATETLTATRFEPDAFLEARRRDDRAPAVPVFSRESETLSARRGLRGVSSFRSCAPTLPGDEKARENAF
ncbi:MAG: hypothetical protein ACRD3V_26340 [Vicinamibacteria bacterium]